MGIFGNVFGQKPEGKKEQGPQEGEASAEKAPQGKYSEPCSLCGNPGTDKKWAGKYWHVKCMRKAKKVAKGMF